MEAPDQESLNLGTAATLAAWFSLQSAPSDVASVFNKWSQTVDDEFLFGISPSRTLYFAWQTTEGGAWGTAALNHASGTGVLPLSTWTHIALVRDGTSLTFYIHGQPEASLSAFDTNPFRSGINTLRGAGSTGSFPASWTRCGCTATRSARRTFKAL